MGDSLARNNFNRSYWELVERSKQEGPYEISGEKRNTIADDFKSILNTLILQTESMELNKRNFQAFTSKLLDSTCPDAFPIRDKNSLKAMKSMGLRAAEYGGVIDYYLSLGEKLQMEMSVLKKWLVKIDQD